jgi:hypothetical protein
MCVGDANVLVTLYTVVYGCKRMMCWKLEMLRDALLRG